MAGLNIEVKYKDGRLRLDVPNQGKPFLNPPDEKGIWTIEGDNSRTISYDRNEAGQVTAMNIHTLTVVPRGMPVSDVIAEIIRTDGLEAAVSKYHELQKSLPDDYFFNEGSFNALGYQFLNEEKYKEAIVIFQLNVETYPDSWNVYDSLAEAFMKKGDKDLAIKYYNKSLELNPHNENGRRMLEQLQKTELEN